MLFSNVSACFLFLFSLIKNLWYKPKIMLSKKTINCNLNRCFSGYLILSAATALQLVYQKDKESVEYILPIVLVAVLIILGVIKLILIRGSF